MIKEWTHLDKEGEASMVDVGEKAATKRKAKATGRVVTTKEVIKKVKKNGLPKGNLFTTAKIAGIQGGKLASHLIPLCHPLLLDNIKVDISIESQDSFLVSAEVACAGRTGVEMEALTAVTTACLTIYDMCKALDRGMIITDVHLIEKSGGKSGPYKHK